jgi:hypothetical protein
VSLAVFVVLMVPRRFLAALAGRAPVVAATRQPRAWDTSKPSTMQWQQPLTPSSPWLRVACSRSAARLVLCALKTVSLPAAAVAATIATPHQCSAASQRTTTCRWQQQQVRLAAHERQHNTLCEEAGLTTVPPAALCLSVPHHSAAECRVLPAGDEGVAGAVAAPVRGQVLAPEASRAPRLGLEVRRGVGLDCNLGTPARWLPSAHMPLLLLPRPVHTTPHPGCPAPSMQSS